VSRADDTPPPGELELAKARLREGLKTCRAIVADCRSKLIRAANPPDGDRPLFPWGNKRGDGANRP
jgi:hypothetical protein